jgi:threonylcarbamoyladenosine tRNA methylthiotransferase MtaB
MKRRHSRADSLALVKKLRAARPDVALGADLIAGFPTEDEAAHARNLSIITELGVVHGHVFPYSQRPGTPAARMPQVDTAAIAASGSLKNTLPRIRTNTQPSRSKIACRSRSSWSFSGPWNCSPPCRSGRGR